GPRRTSPARPAGSAGTSRTTTGVTSAAAPWYRAPRRTSGLAASGSGARRRPRPSKAGLGSINRRAGCLKAAARDSSSPPSLQTRLCSSRRSSARTATSCSSSKRRCRPRRRPRQPLLARAPLRRRHSLRRKCGPKVWPAGGRWHGLRPALPASWRASSGWPTPRPLRTRRPPALTLRSRTGRRPVPSRSRPKRRRLQRRHPLLRRSTCRRSLMRARCRSWTGRFSTSRAWSSTSRRASIGSASSRSWPTASRPRSRKSLDPRRSASWSCGRRLGSFAPGRRPSAGAWTAATR
ncbi:unnamed protein product, partial [Prorocentrum cordatum]